MADVEWPDEVIYELNGIAAYIRVFDPAAAIRMADRLFALGNSLSGFPIRGRLRGDD